MHGREYVWAAIAVISVSLSVAHASAVARTRPVRPAWCARLWMQPGGPAQGDVIAEFLTPAGVFVTVNAQTHELLALATVSASVRDSVELAVRTLGVARWTTSPVAADCSDCGSAELRVSRGGDVFARRWTPAPGSAHGLNAGIPIEAQRLVHAFELARHDTEASAHVLSAELRGVQR